MSHFSPNIKSVWCDTFKNGKEIKKENNEKIKVICINEEENEKDEEN